MTTRRRRGIQVLVAALAAAAAVAASSAASPTAQSASMRAADPPASLSSSSSSSNTVGFGELDEEWRGEVVHLSWKPRAFLYKNFLSDAECRHLKALAQGRMSHSGVVADSATGATGASPQRTSATAFLDSAQDAVVLGVERRVAQVAMVAVDQQEPMQVARYVDGQQYGEF